jgi:hypothetical protein
MRILNIMRILFHALVIPMMRGIAFGIFCVTTVRMLGSGSISGALRQLLIADNYVGGAMLGSVLGFFNVVRTGDTVPVHGDSAADLSNSGLGKDKVELFNPATGLPLVNPDAGSAGIDIHNNSYGSSHNEW